MDDFTQRHLGASTPDQTTMLAALGYTSLDELTDAAVPAAIRLTEPLRLPPARSEFEVQRQLAELAGRNVPGTAMIGLGYHGTITPPVIRRTVLENPAWYTAYTPYQPEISQGRLEALANFQTMISDLTGLPVAGASLLDEGTAVAEAVAVAHRVSRKGGRGRRRRQPAAAEPRRAAHPVPRHRRRGRRRHRRARRRRPRQPGLRRRGAGARRRRRAAAAPPTCASSPNWPTTTAPS